MSRDKALQNEYRCRRRQLGLSQAELAQQAACSQMQISRIERNRLLSGECAKDVLALLLRLEREANE